MYTVILIIESGYGSIAVFYFLLFFIIGRLRSPTPYIGGLPAARGAYVGNFGYQQHLPYGFQQGLMYSPYGYAHCLIPTLIIFVGCLACLA